MTNLLQDLRFSLRQLRKSPGFTLAAVLTLALAIGANAVVFGLLNALILRPLNVPNPQSLYIIEHGPDKEPGESYPDYLDLRDRNRSFDSLALFGIVFVGLDTGKNPAQVDGLRGERELLRHASGFSRIWAVSFTAPTSTDRTALRIWCSATPTGTAIFRMIAA